MQDCATLRNALRKRNDELPGVSNGMQRHEKLCKPLSLNYKSAALNQLSYAGAPGYESRFAKFIKVIMTGLSNGTDRNPDHFGAPDSASF